MELGEKIKQARLAAGLSQRQLCGDTITRNMLSQIENGTAKPSFSTLQALCAKLGLPVSHFLDEAPSENLSILYRATSLPDAQALSLLESFQLPDPMLEPFYQGLRCHLLLSLAESAKPDVAEKYCAQASLLLQKNPSLLGVFGRRLTLVMFDTKSAPAQDLADTLPDNTREQLLRATAAFQKGDTDACLTHLACADRVTPMGLLLEGRALLQAEEFTQAASRFALLETEMPYVVYPLLEECYRELGDFEKAYYYVCKQR